MKAGEAAELRRASARLAVRFAAVILVLFAILIVVTFAVVGASQSEATNRTLVNAGLVDSPRDAPPDVFVAIHADGGTLVSSNAPEWFPVSSLMDRAAGSEDPIQTTKTVNGRTYALRTSSNGGRVVQTAVDTHENSEELGRLAFGLIVAGALAVIGSGFIAALMARRAMRPMLDALALQRRFVTDASHELRTPLTLLSTRAQLLRRQVAEPTREETTQPNTAPIADGLDEILRDSRDLTAILEDLLIASDPRESIDKSPLDLAALADDVVASLQAEAASRGISLERTGDATNVIVNGAHTSLRRLCTSLVSNALDHARSHVTVDIVGTAKLAEIRVSDDGAGFAAGMSGKAFERFATSRSIHDDSSGYRHYGLGLALVAEVAAQHGGSVNVESTRAGEGAVIRVALPLGRAE